MAEQPSRRVHRPLPPLRLHGDGYSQQQTTANNTYLDVPSSSHPHPLGSSRPGFNESRQHHRHRRQHSGSAPEGESAPHYSAPSFYDDGDDDDDDAGSYDYTAAYTAANTAVNMSMNTNGQHISPRRHNSNGRRNMDEHNNSHAQYHYPLPSASSRHHHNQESADIPIQPPSFTYAQQPRVPETSSRSPYGVQFDPRGVDHKEKSYPTPMSAAFPSATKISHFSDSEMSGTPLDFGKPHSEFQVLLESADSYGVHFHKGSATLLMIVLCLTVLMVALDAPILTAVLHPIRDELDWADREDGFAWIGAAFILPWIIVAPIWGGLTMVLPVKPVILCAMAILAAGSLVAGIAKDSDTFLAGRAAQGAGGAGIAASGAHVLHGLFPEHKRGELLRVMGIILGLGMPIGPVVGGSVSHVLNWRWCLLINVPVMALCGFLLCLLMLPENKKKQVAHFYSPGRRHVAWASIFMVIPPCVIFMVCLDLGGVEQTNTSAKILFLPLLGLVWWAVCATVEYRLSNGSYCVVTLGLFRQPGAVVVLLYALIHSFSINAGPFWMSHYFNAVQGMSAIMNAVHLLPFFVASGIVWFAADRWLLAPTASPRQHFLVLVIGHAIMIGGFAAYMDLGADYDLARICGYQTIAAIGGTLSFTATLSVLEADMPDKHAEPAGNAIDFMRAMSMVLALIAGGTAYNQEMHLQYPALAARLGDRVAELILGFEDTGNEKLEALSMEQQIWVREAISKGSHRVWVVLLAMIAASALLLPLIWISKWRGSRNSRHSNSNWSIRSKKKHALT